MDLRDARFFGYIEALGRALGHADRLGPLKSYCAGLLLPGDRKSIEPIAARIEPGRVQAAHQSLHHFVTKAEWLDEAVLAAVRTQTLPALEGQRPLRALVVHDTGFLKKGVHSVGVARQYCGQIGKRDNCQIAVTLWIAGDHASLPIAFQIYLPEAWANDFDRRAKAGVPGDVAFRTRSEIALGQLRYALSAGLPRQVVLADAEYGEAAAFRKELTEIGLPYIVGVQRSIRLWPWDAEPPQTIGGCERSPSPNSHNPIRGPISAQELAQALAASAWRTIPWREGSNVPLTSRFAAVRVRPADRDDGGAARRPHEWLLVEWPEEKGEPINYWLSTLPENATPADLVNLAKLRWRIERDYQELKREIGLGHFEGRGWRGFHHHATLAIAAYGFLISERSRIPAYGSRPAVEVKGPCLPPDYRPRGAAGKRAPGKRESSRIRGQ